MTEKTEEETWNDPRARQFWLLSNAINLDSDTYAPMLRKFVQKHADFIEDLMGPGFSVVRK